MTIQDTHLTQMAKAMNNESYTIPSFQAVSTATFTPDIADTSLQGEIGTRIALTGARIINQLELTGIRSGTDVVDTANGDSITAVGMLSAISAGDLHTETASISELHTTAFDIEFITDLTYTRR